VSTSRSTDMGDFILVETGEPTVEHPTVWFSSDVQWKTGTPQDLLNKREARIAAAVPVLRQWATDARATTVTQGNAVATLQVVVTRLGTFFDNFADLLQSIGKG
jgi:hypothetical protein